MKETIKKLAFEPFRGPHKEVLEGKNTLIKLFDNRLNYKIDYKSNTYFTTLTEHDEEELEEVVTYFEEGTFLKEDIKGITKKIDTILITMDDEGNKLPEPKQIVKRIVSIFAGTDYVFSFENEKEWNKSYKELYNWKYNITTNE
jgi:hypothetical protein